MKCFLTAFFLLVAVTIFAQMPDPEIDIQVTTLFGSPAPVADYLLVKVKPEYKDNLRKILRRGVVRQVAPRWFIINHPDIYARLSLPLFEKMVTANNSWKLSPALLQRSNEPAESLSLFLVTVSDTAAFKRLAQQHTDSLTLLPGSGEYHLFRVRTSFAFIQNRLLDKAYVVSVQNRSSAPKEEAVINNYDNSVNSTNLLFAKYPAATGEGLTVSIKENIFDKDDIDFKNRYKETGLASASTTSHATTMATLVAGGGNSFFTGKGGAPAALIASADFVTLLPDGDSYATNNISVQNHSYGVGIENFYGSDAASYDQSMVDNPTLLHIFSAGNSGTEKDTLTGSPYRNLEGFANLTGSFKMAKNILTVGAVDSFFTVSPLSSKGPAYDVRITPELVAYGNDGSSGAAAITSGTALAVQSAYAQQHNNVLPANALAKAILINSADDVNRKGPDYISGYGNVNAYRAVQDISSGNYFTGTVSDGETTDFTLPLPANTRNLKITLVWTDPAAQTNTLTALVNDLDLRLEKGASQWRPWVLNSAANADSLRQVARRKRDSLNVVEQVTIDTPANGNYTIHVTGYNVPEGPQSFSIAYHWDTANRFYFVSPAAKDHFTAGGQDIFRWKSTYNRDTKGRLEYSTNNGVSWRLITANADLTTGYFSWNVPDTFTTAFARMTIGTDVYLSDTFNLSKQLYPQVGFNCEDSTLIFWNKAAGISRYQVYTLGDKYLGPLSVTTDTSIVIKTAASAYVAVAPVLQGSNTGVTSYTFNYADQGVECYISNFLADLTPDKTALLQLSLGTVYDVSNIIFQQLTPGGWQPIQTISPVTLTENSYETSSMHAGINTFRAVVTLNNGATINSNEAIVYFTGTGEFTIMPNPVPHGQKLTVLCSNFATNTLVLFDITGRKVLQQSISGTRSDINLLNLSKGIYILVIYAEGRKVFNSKLVIQ